MELRLEEKALKYHSGIPAGKICIGLSKPVEDYEDFSLTYTPGVGAPCMEIHKKKEKVWDYTNRGNTVAVISDGTAVLGLGDIGPEAGLPVMEGKAVIFKKFADIDAIPLCMGFDKSLPEDDLLTRFENAVLALEPSFGGINLEDIKAPRCFSLLHELDKKMNIPVFHDDQDGTAIVLIAGVLNALKLAQKELSQVNILINGAGAAGLSCARFFLSFGVKKEQIFICDSKGLLTTDRTDLNDYKKEFAQSGQSIPLEEAIRGKDIFIGVSVRNVLKPHMIKSMNPKPIIFAVANPIPEIMPEVALEAGAFVVGSGRSDYPNQVNNSLGFPGIFRATLDTRSSVINHQMKLAATLAIADLGCQPIPSTLKTMLAHFYPDEARAGTFDSPQPLSTSYLIPKQFDLRVVPRVARYVAEAAMQSGVAQISIIDLDLYEQEVFDRVKKNWAHLDSL